MITICKIDATDKAQVRRFVRIPYKLYKDHYQWVPPLYLDAEMQLNREKHPYYEHSEADFFVAERNGQDVGRIAILENKQFNRYHNTHKAQFYLFECKNDQEAATALFNRAFEWAIDRNLDQIIGPKGFGALDGYGLLLDGYKHRQIMTMMNYNYPYYQQLIETIGFEKEVDFVSCYLNAEKFRLPERIHRIARRVLQRGNLGIKRFKSKKELRKWAPKIGQAYNKAFVDNWEYYPLSNNEIKFILDTILTVADPRLIKVITHDHEAVGFLFGFPDLSSALQKAKGRLMPLGILHLLHEMRRTKWIALNGAGILPEFHGHGGNALLYAEMENTIRDYQFEHADLTQIGETAVQMRQDLANLGGVPYKNHRVYRISI